MWGREKEGKGCQIYDERWKLDFGGEHTIKYTNIVLQSVRTPEIHTMLLK